MKIYYSNIFFKKINTDNNKNRKSKIPYSTVATGANIANEYRSPIHIGVDDTYVGKAMASKLLENLSNSSKAIFVCVDHMLSADITTNDRCMGLKEVIEHQGGIMYSVSIDGSFPTESMKDLKAQLEIIETKEGHVDSIISVGDFGASLLNEFVNYFYREKNRYDEFSLLLIIYQIINNRLYSKDWSSKRKEVFFTSGK